MAVEIDVFAQRIVEDELAKMCDAVGAENGAILNVFGVSAALFRSHRFENNLGIRFEDYPLRLAFSVGSGDAIKERAQMVRSMALAIVAMLSEPRAAIVVEEQQWLVQGP